MDMTFGVFPVSIGIHGRMHMFERSYGDHMWHIHTVPDNRGRGRVLEKKLSFSLLFSRKTRACQKHTTYKDTFIEIYLYLSISTTSLSHLHILARHNIYAHKLFVSEPLRYSESTLHKEALRTRTCSIDSLCANRHQWGKTGIFLFRRFALQKKTLSRLFLYTISCFSCLTSKCL